MRKLKNIITFTYIIYKIRKIINVFRKNKRLLKDVYADFLHISGLDKKVSTSDIYENLLNTNFLDEEIDLLMSLYIKNLNIDKLKKINDNQNAIGIIFTELYDVGGHTPLIKRLIQSFIDDYKLTIFSTKINIDKKFLHSKNLKNTQKLMIEGVDVFWNDPNLESKALKLYKKIINSNVHVLFCYIHPYDVVISAALSVAGSSRCAPPYFNLG